MSVSKTELWQFCKHISLRGGIPLICGLCLGQGFSKRPPGVNFLLQLLLIPPAMIALGVLMYLFLGNWMDRRLAKKLRLLEKGRE